MEGHLTYTIDGVERKMFFGNYALEQTLLEMGASVTEVSDLLNNKLLTFIRTFIYHAYCYPILAKGEQVDITPFTIYSWIDSTGGTNGDFIQKASKCIYTTLGVGESDGKEKKSNKKA